MTEILQSEGYEVMTANNGLAALDALKKTSALPHLIVLDLLMPVMDGFEFLRLQSEDPRLASIPVVVMTADENPEKKQRLSKLTFIKKSGSLDEILKAIQKHCPLPK